MAIKRHYKDTTRFNKDMKGLRSILRGVKHAKLHNLGNNNKVDIFWDLNDKSMRHALFKIQITGKIDGKRVKLDAVVPFEELAYYARDF